MQILCARIPKRQVVLGILYLFLTACSTNKAPSIEIRQVPPASQGGTGRLATIRGRVLRARAGQRIVLFARSGGWWVQPFANQPFTSIQSDGSWSNSTHLGTEYAVVLVDAEYQPPALSAAAPKTGKGVIAVEIVKGAGPASEAVEPAPKIIHFSGYDWRVLGGENDHGGSVHSYDPANGRVGADGFLHLRITGQPKQWVCSETVLTRSLGYGTYSFTVKDVSRLEPAAALSMFTWSDLGTDQNHREIDVNISRWGNPQGKNAEYVLQPYYRPENVFRFVAPSGPVAFSFRWEPGSVSFESRRGGTKNTGISPISAHIFSVGAPSPGGESVHLNFCAFPYSKVPLQHEAEVVIERFQYLP